MANKEATARIKINKLLEASGWRFFAEYRALIPNYIKDYVSLNQFAP